MKKILLIVIVAILVFTCVQNFYLVIRLCETVYGLLSPLITGICIAFILNVLLKLLEEKVFSPLNRKSSRIWLKLRRPLCLLLTYAIVAGIVMVLMLLIVPELSNSFNLLKEQIPGYVQSFQQWTDELLASLHIPAGSLKNLRVDWETVFQKLGQFLEKNSEHFVNTTVGATSAIFSGVFNFVLGVAFSVYILMKKELLCNQARRITLAYLPRRGAEYLISVGKLSNKIFAKFVAGQLTEAVIIGVLCFLGMSVFSMPYASLIATIVGATALVPIFGAFIGTALGAFLLLMVDPMQALWFIVFILVLQQLEGNIIYPRVVGSSVGLPGIWVLFTVMVGGGLFGIMGMLVGIPVASVAYCLLKNAVAGRLRARKITPEDVARAGSGLEESTEPATTETSGPSEEEQLSEQQENHN